MSRPKLTDEIIIRMMYDSCPSELCYEECEHNGVYCVDECDKMQLEEYKHEIYQQGKTDLLNEIHEKHTTLPYNEFMKWLAKEWFEAD